MVNLLLVRSRQACRGWMASTSGVNHRKASRLDHVLRPPRILGATTQRSRTSDLEILELLFPLCLQHLHQLQHPALHQLQHPARVEHATNLMAASMELHVATFATRIVIVGIAILSLDACQRMHVWEIATLEIMRSGVQEVSLLHHLLQLQPRRRPQHLHQLQHLARVEHATHLMAALMELHAATIATRTAIVGAATLSLDACQRANVWEIATVEVMRSGVALWRNQWFRF